MINVINTNALKSIPLSQFTAADFGYANDVQRLPVDRAYREVGWYRRGLDLRANGVSGMPFDLMKGENVVFTEQSNLGDVPDVLNIFNLLGQMTLDLDKYGACYAVFETDIFGYKKEWRRLHPSSIKPEFNHSTGELTHFTRWYGAKNNKHRFELDELLWLWMPPDNSENMPGAGVGFTALLAATGMANKDKFAAYYFERGAINPTLVKIKGFAQQPPDEQKRVTNVLQKLMSGIRNAFKIVPIDGEIDVHQLMSTLKDMELGEMTTQQREDISTTLGIPLTMMFSNAANYATAAQDDFHFYDKTIAPFCRMVIAPQLNERLFERAGLQLRFVKNRLEVYQEMESKKAYALVPLFDRKLVSANQVLQYLDMEEFEKDWYKDTSIPSEVSVSGEGNEVVIEDEADYTPERKRLPHPLTPSPLASARSSHDYREGEQKAVPTVGNEAYVVIDLSLRPELVAMQQMLRDALVGVDVQWQTPETFHITLVYCYDIDDRSFERTVIDGFEPFAIRVSGVGMFNTPGNRALVLQIDHYPELDTLQKRVWVEFAQVNTSDYSVPQRWQPHCTMAYLPDGVDMPQIDFQPFTLMVDCVEYVRDDYRVAYAVEASQPSPLAPLPQVEGNKAVADIEKWERMALKRWDEGKRDKAIQFESVLIPAGLKGAIKGGLDTAKTIDDVKLVFADAIKYASHV